MHESDDELEGQTQRKSIAAVPDTSKERDRKDGRVMRVDVAIAAGAETDRSLVRGRDGCPRMFEHERLNLNSSLSHRSGRRTQSLNAE